MNEQEQQPPSAEIDWSSDSVRLLINEETKRVECMVIMDVTELTPEQQIEFKDKCLVALTRMGMKLIQRRK